MATHSDTDHISYLDEVLSEFQAGNVYMPNIRSNNLDKSVKIGGRDVKVGDIDASKLKSLPIKIQSTLKDIPSFHCGVVGAELQYHAQYRKYEIRDKITPSLLLFVAGRVGQQKSESATQINAVSPIGILEYAGRRLVFTGDSNESNEKYYCETYPYVDCDVLKVAHHGSRTSSSEDFLQHVKCEYAVISVGDGNSYGHPEQEALDRLKANGIQKSTAPTSAETSFSRCRTRAKWHFRAKTMRRLI